MTAPFYTVCPECGIHVELHQVNYFPELVARDPEVWVDYPVHLVAVPDGFVVHRLREAVG